MRNLPEQMLEVDEVSLEMRSGRRHPRPGVDQVTRNRIVYFLAAIDFLLLVGLLAFMGWLDPILRFPFTIFLSLNG